MAQDDPRVRTVVERVDGDAFFLSIKGDPEIPDGFGRSCPQCARTTWSLSRFCWHCRFDFDRAFIAKLHPVKLLFFSAVMNAALLVACAVLIARFW